MVVHRKNGRKRLEISAEFWLLLAWLNYTDEQGLLVWTVLAAGAHELGHWCAFRLQGVHLECLKLSAVGAEMCFQGKLSYLEEVLCSIAGPATNLILAVLFARIERPWALAFAGINMALCLFNLVPVCRLDGGQVLHCVLVLLLGMERGELVKRKIDMLCILLCLAVGIWLVCSGGNITLLIIGIWLSIIFQKSSWEKGCKRATE